MKNQLGAQTSPYLLQHADNPVHWQPWGPEAFARAREENKPVLLSVGYAACHWCHVMAHESFEDAATAELMNTLFVNIKVDREERPDLDIIYQTALALLGEHGGWPLTMFLTPDAAPFWGGTYFPPEASYGRPAFTGLLLRVDQVWREKTDVVTKNVATMTEALNKTAASAAGDLFSPVIADRLAEHLLKEFDPVHGGIGTAPKFPNVPVLDLVLRAHHRNNSPKLADAVFTALRQMSQGGIYDHLGGGYSRYSTDALWLVPHFEKMLYDNAQLIDLLLFAFRVCHEALFVDRLTETADWVIREMTVDGGGFAGTLDADSEDTEGKSVEGAFYVWQAPDIDALLGEDADFFKKTYGVADPGNWEGKTVLNRLGNPRFHDSDTEARLQPLRDRLLTERDKRKRPARDDKVLADGNGLMIAALARAGETLGRDDWTRAAIKAYDFVRTKMVPDAGIEEGQGASTKETLLVHSFCAGRPGPIAILDDYAAMIRAALMLYETTANPDYLDHARAWVETLEHHYADVDGGFFLTSNDAQDLIVRTKSASDGPTPAGNGLMVANYARLWLLTGNTDFAESSRKLIRAFSGGLEQQAFSLSTMINGAELLERAAQTVIIGDRSDPQTKDLIRAALTAAQPNLVLQVIAPDCALPSGHPAYGKPQINNQPTAYVCVGPVCSLPHTEAKELTDALARA